MVNNLAVFIGALAAFVVGFLYYSPMLPTGRLWMKLAGMPDKKPATKDMILRSLGGLATYIVMAYILAMFIEGAILDRTLYLTFILWLGFIGTITFGSFLWERKPFGLWVLNNIYNLLSLVIIALVIFAWP